MFNALQQIGWKGIVEFDCHMLRAEGDLNDQIGCRKEFIKNCIRALSIAITLAARIKPGKPTSQSAGDLDSIMQMCGLDNVQVKR